MGSLPSKAAGSPTDGGWDSGRDLLVVLGRGGESLVHALRARGQVRILLFVEPGTSVAELPEHVRVATNEAQLFEAVLALSGRSPGRITLRCTGDPWATRERAEATARVLKESVASRVLQVSTVEKAGKTWLLQGLANARALAEHPSIALLRGTFTGRPCVIVSPGPSLSKSLPHLPALRDRALIVSGTHALHALQTAGVPPHLIVAADPGDLRRHFERIDLSAVDALVVGATCRSELFALPARRRFGFASNGRIDDWLFCALGEEAGLPSGGSVACSQFSLALHLGCDPILFVGQDLSFTDRFYAEEGLDGDAHVEASGRDSFVLTKEGSANGPGTLRADGRLGFTVPQAVVEVAGYYGGRVRTTPTLASFLAWFEAKALSLGGAVRLWNCTEGGAAIRGMEPLPLAEARRRLWDEPLDAGALLERAVSGLDRPARLARMAEHLGRARGALDLCAERAARCRLLAHGALTDARRREELGRAEKDLSSALSPLRLFVSLVAQSEISAAQEEARGARDLASNLHASRRLFEAVRGACAFLRKPLDRALGALRSRAHDPRAAG